MGTIPTLVQERAAPRLVDEVIAPRMVSLARCESCGSPNVFSTLETSAAIYWRCQRCGELSVTEKDFF
jgi:ribosomal protein L37AE/L43A